uniref:Medium-chain acyl-CoA ligase ACSF2, mitochondrial n=2 Tax=Clytia hemisphaerica TaxID=252671 RepID=A0A7M5X7U4_9CNID
MFKILRNILKKKRYARNLHSAKLIESYDHVVSEHKLIGKTIGQVFNETVEKFPDHEAVVFHRDKKRMTFAQLDEKVNTLAASIIGLGLQKGDRVGIWGQNHLEWIITFLASGKAGTILVNVNPSYQSKELHYALNKVGMKALFMTPEFKTSNYYDILQNVTPEILDSHPGQLKSKNVPTLESVILTEGPALDGAFSFEDALAIGGKEEKIKVEQLQKGIRFDDPVNIQFTSGTTGNPKGATLTHHNLVNNAAVMSHITEITEEDRVCTPQPLYHCFGTVIGCLASLINGATQVYPTRGIDPAATLEAIENERCTVIYGIPTMFLDMLHHPTFKRENMKTLRTGCLGGQPCPPQLMRRIIEDMDCPEFTIGYGLTETSPIVTFADPNAEIERRMTTIGKTLPHMETKIIDEEGHIVPVNTSGELCFRGHCVFQGYWDDVIKTKEAIDENGWFHSGDLGQIDENGYCKVVGRLKDMIIRGGENIYPTEVENFLHNHPDIEDVQIVGIPDERFGEECCAWIK